MFGRKKAEDKKEERNEPSEIVDVVKGVNVPSISEALTPPKPKEPLPVFTLTDEEKAFIEEKRKKEEEARKAQEEKKYSFVVCPECGSVFGKSV